MAICLKPARAGRTVEELGASACSPDAQLHLSMSKFKVSDNQKRSTGDAHHIVWLTGDRLLTPNCTVAGKSCSRKRRVQLDDTLPSFLGQFCSHNCFFLA